MKRHFHLTIAATSEEVRDLLLRASRLLTEMSVGEDAVQTAEIVLAEVLNNIVEHAYAGMQPGPIDLRGEVLNGRMVFAIGDQGQPMPGLKLPAKTEADIDVEREDLPEGGFGWFMIHELTQDLTYQRQSGQNVVRLSLPLD